MVSAQNLGLVVVGLVVDAGAWYYMYCLICGGERNKRVAGWKNINPTHKKIRKYKKL